MDVTDQEQMNNEHVFPNPNLQYGSTDWGYGWTEMQQGDWDYEQHPEGMYAFTEGQPHF